MSQRNLKHEEGALSFTPSLDINNEDPPSANVTLSFFCLSQISQHQYLQPCAPPCLFFPNQCEIYFDGKGLVLQLGEFAK